MGSYLLKGNFKCNLQRHHFAYGYEVIIKYYLNFITCLYFPVALIRWNSSHGHLMKLHFVCKQPVYKQLVLGWQIAKQLSELNPLSLSNNKNYELKESGIFPLKQT